MAIFIVYKQLLSSNYQYLVLFFIRVHFPFLIKVRLLKEVLAQRAHLNVREEVMDSTSITLMLNIIVHNIQTTLAEGLIDSMKGLFLKGTSLYAFMCIPLELPFLASLFLYVRNSKLIGIEHSSEMKCFAFIFKWMLFIVLRKLYPFPTATQ